MGVQITTTTIRGVFTFVLPNRSPSTNSSSCASWRPGGVDKRRKRAPGRNCEQNVEYNPAGYCCLIGFYFGA